MSDPERRDEAARDRHRDRAHDDRAGNVCPTCGRSFDDVERVDVHHDDGNPRNGSPENLRKRCRRCHLKEEHGRDPELWHRHDAVPSTGFNRPPSPRSTDPR